MNKAKRAGLRWAVSFGGLSFLLLGCTALAQTPQAERPAGATFFVAVGGNDAWSGTLAEPNATQTDGPFATLDRARDAIRKMKKAAPLPDGGVTVRLRGGCHLLRQTFKLGAADGGTPAAPIVYRAYENEKPLLMGCQPVSGFVPYQGKILKADLAAQGLRGVYFRQLYFAGKRQHLARYPNYDPNNPYGGGWAYADGKSLPMYVDIPGEDRRTLHYKAHDARPWARPEEGQVFVFPRYNWWNNVVRIASIDRQQRIVRLAADASYPIRPGDRYYVQNLFEELDSPGEWYLDKNTWTLYFWPPPGAGEKGLTAYAPTMRTIIQIGPGTARVAIRGLTIEGCEGTAVTLTNTADCLIAGNTIRNVGDYGGAGVSVSGGKRNGVAGNDICETGSHGISLSGGDRITLTPAENYADNNYIHHVGVFYKQGVGIDMTGCGNRASHNLIHDGPRMGIQFAGNNLLLEYNHIRHMNLETEDTGAVYTGGRDWIGSRGSVIRYNYFHDMLGYGRENGKWVSPHFAWGVYLDDNAGGVDVIGNIVVRASRAGIHLHNGRDNVIQNNVFVENALVQVEYSGWTEAHKYWTTHLPTMIKGYESVAHQPAWQNMRNMRLHPTQAVLPDKTIMSGNVLQRNIFYYRNPAAKLFRFSHVNFHYNTSDYNLVYHFGQPLVTGFSRIKAKAPAPNRDEWESWRATGQDQHSLRSDPLFVDPEKDDYRLRPDSPAFKLGFKTIPVEKIGPYRDPLRATWPIVEAEGAREKPLVSE